MSDPAYDGLCGVPSLSTLSGGTHVRCKHEFGHGGKHDWEDKRIGLHIFGGITAEEVEERAARGSPAAQAILATRKP